MPEANHAFFRPLKPAHLFDELVAIGVGIAALDIPLDLPRKHRPRIFSRLKLKAVGHKERGEVLTGYRRLDRISFKLSFLAWFTRY